MKTIYKTDFKELNLVANGKVRDIYDLGDKILLLASDRLSAFDVVFSQPIPAKGIVLTQISKFWFEKTAGIIKNHIISCDVKDFPEITKPYQDELKYRTMLVKKTKPLKAECIVRGYLDGSALKAYQQTKSVCGVSLPDGLKKKSKLSEPIFTPTTKAEEGHDENITFNQMKDIVGSEISEKVREASIKLFSFAHDYLLAKGIIISDTKFEFGINENGELILIDECMTPDSSRFWVADTYKDGVDSQNYDKQYVRDFLEASGWDKTPPAPNLPEEVISNTTKRYIQAYEVITGNKWNFEI